MFLCIFEIDYPQEEELTVNEVDELMAMLFRARLNKSLGVEWQPCLDYPC